MKTEISVYIKKNTLKSSFYFMRLRAACYYETEKSAGFPPFVRLNFVVECKVNYCKVRIEVLIFVSRRKIVVIPNVMR